MLKKVTRDMDTLPPENIKPHKLDESSFADLPSELTMTEDNRMAIQGADFRFNMATFEASKKLLKDTATRIPLKFDQLCAADIEPHRPETNTLLRRLEIFEGFNQSLKLLHTVTCTGFNASAPRLIYSSFNPDKNTAVLDKGNSPPKTEDSSKPVGGPLFLQLLTDNILRSFAISQVIQVSCGFEHCIAVTASGSIVSWGYGASGSLGHGNYMSYTQPKLITAGGISARKVVYGACGGYHTGCVTEDGELYTWGRADVGQLGLTEDQLQTDDMGKVCTYPKAVRSFKNPVAQIALGEAHTLVLDT